MTCVTMFYDIGRSSFTHGSRSPEVYLNSFYSFFSRVACDLIVICGPAERVLIDNYLRKRVSKPLSSRLTYCVVPFEEFPIFPFRSEISAALNSAPMALYSLRDRAQESVQAVTRRRVTRRMRRGAQPISAGIETLTQRLGLGEPTAPEYTNVEYVMVVMSKMFAIEIALQSEGATTQRLTWMDFAFGHSDPRFLQHVDGKRFHDPDPESKLLDYVRRGSGPLPKSAWEFANLMDDALTPTGLFTVPTSLVAGIGAWWVRVFLEHLQMGLVLDDQVIHGLYCAAHPAATQEIVRLGTTVAPIHTWLPIDSYLVDGTTPSA